MTQPLYSFRRKGRSWPTLIALGIAWSVLVLIWTVFDAAGLLVALGFALTRPAARDLYSGRMAGLDLTTEELRWFSGGQEVALPLSEIDHIRLVTRLDMSVRAAVVLSTGRKLRLPVEAMPPHEPFAQALADAGLRSERHHFTGL